MGEYTERDIEKLDLEGNYYCRHIVAMTKEGLFGKSQIAAELAFRDCELSKLRAENQELREALEAIEHSGPWGTCIICTAGDDEEHWSGCKLGNALKQARGER